MIISFEYIFIELEKLLIQKLPDYIEKVNIKHNDGIILKKLENKSVHEECIKEPCFKFESLKGKQSQKDRIISQLIFELDFELKLKEQRKEKTIRFWRYLEAMQMMFDEEETQYSYNMCDFEKNHFFIEVREK